MKKTVLAIAVSLIASACLWSCKVAESAPPVQHEAEGGGIMEEQENEELSDWQKKVLKKRGLPEDYSKLTASQKLSVKRIYEMKKYLDDKYGMEFEYAGYVEGGLLEKEQFMAYPKDQGTDGGRNIYTVTVNEDGSFSDSASDPAVRISLEKLLNDYVTDFFGEGKAVVFVTGCENGPATAEDVEKGRLRGISSVNEILVSGADCDSEKLKTFVKALYDWCGEKELCGRSIIRLFPDTDMSKVNSDNYTDYYLSATERYEICLSADGSDNYIIPATD
ncbi:MAG: hypothetical protein IKH78_06495 [Ruminococcus sp.]|nr:hypothetical protein [Ruminococcus sp.]